MKKSRLLTATILASLATLVPFNAVSAQEATPETALEEIIVTGSRITRPNLDSTVPITTL
jgi:cell division septal protein FtsQ